MPPRFALRRRIVASIGNRFLTQTVRNWKAEKILCAGGTYDRRRCGSASSAKKTLKGEAILEHLGMAATQIDQFTQALFGKVESVLIVCAVLILVVGVPLHWLR